LLTQLRIAVGSVYQRARAGHGRLPWWPLLVHCSSAGGAEEDFCIPEERECDGRQPIVLLVVETG
jgi:hypothetical protein